MSEDVVLSKPKTLGRIRRKNQEVILEAAELVFSRCGYEGASLNDIAAASGLPKANLHYYFQNKKFLYLSVLNKVLDKWEAAFECIDAQSDPATALSTYIRTRLELARTEPLASRVLAMEIISGAKILKTHYQRDYAEWFKQRTEVFQRWIDEGKISHVNPAHLSFLIWSSTQYYADFASYIQMHTEKSRLTKDDFHEAASSLEQIILKGLGLTLPNQP